MNKDNYSTIKNKLRTCIPFDNGHSMHAYIWTNDEGHKEYRVISYQTCIATYDMVTGEKWLNDAKYSVTTSKQQGYVSAYLARDL